MRKWTRGEVRVAVLAREDGELLKRIARQLGRTRDSVMQRLRRVGAVKTLTLEERCLALCRLGLTVRSIAEILRVSVASVQTSRWRLRQAGFDVPDGRRGRSVPSRRRRDISRG